MRQKKTVRVLFFKPQLLQEFYQKVEQANLPEFKKAIQTLQNWQVEILNSFVYNFSNGFLEGINNLTKVMKRNAFGFRSFKRFRAKILLTHKYKKWVFILVEGEVGITSPQHLTLNLFLSSFFINVKGLSYIVQKPCGKEWDNG